MNEQASKLEPFSPELLAEEYKTIHGEYLEYRTNEIKQLIRQRFRPNESGSLWITFYDDEGPYEQVIEYFRNSGFEVKSPSGPTNGNYTSFLFRWKHVE